MNNLIDIEQDLNCPISLSLFDDPINVPCCGKVFSRISLIQQFESGINKNCPLCGQNLGYFDVENTKKNVVIASLVESFKKNQNNVIESSIQKNLPKWNCTITSLHGNNGTYLPIGELEITLENANFIPRPTLFIAVVDKSGSMSGNPWKQVQIALIHIMSLTNLSSNVKTVIIPYDSIAYVLHTLGTQQDINRSIKTLEASGGTVFGAAFNKIKEVLSEYIYSDSEDMLHLNNNMSNVSIAFLTDGQPQGENKTTLIPQFKEILKKSWNGPISVHAIGFGQECDKDLLEGLRTTGNIEGTFRYAEPQDGGDALCSKLTTLFDSLRSSSAMNLKLKLDLLKFRMGKNILSEIDLLFPIDQQKNGTYKLWVELNESNFNDETENFDQNLGSLLINSANEKQIIPIIFKEKISNNEKKILYENWMSIMIDELACEILELSSQNKENYGQQVFDLHCALIKQKIQALDSCIEQNSTNILLERLQSLLKEINSISLGNDANKGKLADLRFGSQFVSIPKNKAQQSVSIPQNTETKLIQMKKENHVNYSRNNMNKNRNELQQAIMNNLYNSETTEILNLINSSSIDDIYFKDVDGNNTLMLAAYCGQSINIKIILDKYTSLDLEQENLAGETALTLAIKKQGRWKSIKILLDAGATVPIDRSDGLQQYAIDNNFKITANMISKIQNKKILLNESMTTEYIEFTYETLIKENKQIDIENFMKICVSKCMIDLVIKLLQIHNAKPSIDMLFESCIAESENHLKLTQILLENNNGVDLNINQLNSNGDSLLFRASEKGSLAHLKLFISKGAIIDLPNLLGNTPLWIACWKRYPCIISELLDCGADVNHKNKKGNPPMEPICQKGPKKIAEMLLARGARVDSFNEKGDSLLLLCCRNGQSDILRLLLNNADTNIINHRAHIDGFSMIFASTESNRSDCIQVLHEYGIDLEEKTDDNNPILRRATPLHLAAYYNRIDAARTLLSCGSNPDSKDINDQTPLHFAVMQGNKSIIKLLKNYNADCNVKDVFGNTPISYCRNSDDDEIKKLFVDPLLNILMKLARGQFGEKEEKNACTLLINKVGILGCLSKANSIDVIEINGKSPLMEAIIYSNFNVVKTLLYLGANPYRINSMGLNSFVWSEWIGNFRIKQLLSQKSCEIEIFINRLKQAANLNSQNSSLLYLGSKPSKIQEIVSDSKINEKMEDFIGDITTLDQIIEPVVTDLETKQKIVIDDKNLSIIEYISKKIPNHDNSEIENLIWQAKIFIVNLVASGTYDLSPQQIMSIYLYNSNTLLYRIINESIIKNDIKSIEPYFQCLCQGLDSLSPFEGEIFRGVKNLINRKLFLVNNKISWKGFSTCSTSWRVALENCSDFTSSKKQGTIFLIKSKTSKYLGQYSPYPQDSIVMYKPNTKFIVTAWYMGDIIALGQSNIRNTTFKIKEENMDKMINGNNSLIIELEEL